MTGEIPVKMLNKQLLAQEALNKAKEEGLVLDNGQLAVNSKILVQSETISIAKYQQLTSEIGLDEAQQHQIISSLGLSVADGKNLITTKELTFAKIKEAVASAGVKSETDQEAIAKALLTKANKTASMSAKELVAAKLAAMAANPITWIIAIGVAIFGVVKLVDALTVSLEEQQEKTEELKSEYDEIASKLQKVNSELETTQSRIDELNGKDNLSIVEKDELEQLKLTNDELERQNILLKEQEEYKKKEVATSVKKEYDKKDSNEFDRGWTTEISDEDESRIAEIDDQITKLEQQIALGNFTEETYKQIDSQIAALQKERDEISNKYGLNNATSYLDDEQWIALAKQKYNQLYLEYIKDPSSFKYTTDKDGNTVESDDYKLMEEIRQQLIDKAIELDDYVERYGIDDEFSQGLHDLFLEISYTLHPGEFKTELFEKEFEKMLPTEQEKLKTLAGRHELNVDTLTDIFPQESIDNLSEYGITVSDIINQLNLMVNSVDDVANSVKSFNEVLNGINSLDDGLGILTDIYDDVKDKGTFDYSSILGNDDFDKAFGSYTEEYNNFLKTIATSPDDLSKCQSAFNDLATAYIYNSDAMKDVTKETKNQTIAMLEQMGVSNASDVVTQQLIVNEEELALRKQFTAKYGIDLKYATEEETAAFLAEANATDVARYALFNYQLEEQVINSSSLDVSGKIETLGKLAAAYGITGVQAEYANKQDQALMSHTQASWSQADLDRMIEDVQNQISAKMSSTKIDFTGAVSSSSGSETDPKDELDKYLSYYEAQLDAGQITYKEYVDKCSDIRDRFYADGKITAEEYAQYKADLYEKEINYYDKAENAIEKVIDNQIKKLEDQKEALEDFYNGQIEAIQDIIDQLEKENEAREKAIALQKAQYELNRAQNQRIDYLYKDGQFVYTAKDSAIRDAQNELDDQKHQMQIDDLNQQIDDLNKALEDSTDIIDQQIDSLNEYKDKWSEIASVYEEQQNALIAADILGADWEQQILDGRLDTLENFKNDYIEMQQAMADATVEAQKIIQKANAGDTSGGSVVGNPTPDPNLVLSTANETPYYVMQKVSSGYKTQGEATSQISKYNGDYADKIGDLWYVLKKLKGFKTQGEATSQIGILNGVSVHKFAKGGMVGSSNLDYLAKSVGEDHIVAAKEGERILTPLQNANFEKLVNISDAFIKLFNPMENMIKAMPDYTKMIKNSNTNNEVKMEVNINCPNVTNESGFNYIKKEITSLTTKALQFDWNN